MWPDCSGSGGRIAPEWVAGMLRIQWPPWSGLGGRDAPEYATTNAWDCAAASSHNFL